MSKHSNKITNNNNQLNKQTNRNTVVENCNDEKRPAFYGSPALKYYYILKDRIWILLNGDPELIENTDKVDLEYYCKMPLWSIDTAITLSLGQTPRKIRLSWYTFSPEFREEYLHRKILLTKAIEQGLIKHKMEKYKANRFFTSYRQAIVPLDFVKWAKELNIDHRFNIEEIVKKYDKNSDVDSESMVKELYRENWVLKQRVSNSEESLDKRVELSYQMVIAGLLRLKFANNDSITACNISSLFGEIDFPFKMIGEETIYKRLEPAKRLLGIMPKKSKKVSAN